MRLRRHQREALDAIAASEDQRHWVVLPPGAGKTLVGVSAALRWGRPVVVFGPNLAIVEQWRQAWEDVAGGPTSSDRTLPTRFTALTYQSLAVFDAESDAVQGTARLHPNGIALVERLHEAGPITLILDDTEVTLRAGDIVVQRGTDHAWANRSDGITKVAFILVDGQFDPVLAESIGGLDGLMHGGPRD